MKKLLASPWARLAGRAAVAGIAAGVIFYRSSAGGPAAEKGAIVAGVLAFCEMFTPLNALVGVFKGTKT